MAKIGILVPREEMRLQTMQLLEEVSLDVVCCRSIETADTLNEARRAVEEGAQLIIARGYQAKILRENTQIPLVEIRFTAQEVCLFLQRARVISGKEHPHIAIIAFKNMLPDMTYIESLMDVDLTVSYLEKVELVDGILSEYEEDRPDVVIGGQITCGAAQERGYLTLFYQSTRESILQALRMAQRISFAMDSEQQHIARFETVLDSTFNAILQVNTDRAVIHSNRTAQELLGKTEQELAGKKLDEVLKGIRLEALEQVLSGARESIATSADIKNEAFMVVIAAIRFNERITGAILSFRQISAMSGLSRQAYRELLLSGYRTNITFRDIQASSPQMREVLGRAEIFALSDNPVLFYDVEGNEAAMIARAIHNNSDRKAGPFVSMDIRDLYPEEQIDALLYRGGTPRQDPRRLRTETGEDKQTDSFRHKNILNDAGKSPAVSAEASSVPPALGAMIRANHGTLFINRIEKLTLQAQHQLLRILLPMERMHTDARPLDVLDVRIIACAKHNLLPAVEDDTFSEELYYRFSGLMLEIPPLGRRPEDLKSQFRERFQKYASKYNRPLHLTEEGLRLVPQLRWPGGYAQLDAFCERLVLSSTRRRQDEQAIRDLFNTLYPQVRSVEGEQRLVVYDAPEAQLIRELLEKHQGDRAAVAAELGISKTTLWRHMKKYNVKSKY